MECNLDSEQHDGGCQPYGEELLKRIMTADTVQEMLNSLLVKFNDKVLQHDPPFFSMHSS